jgi:hypothetical protein
MGVSHEDVVRASLVDGSLFFDRVERRSGHSTYRFVTMDGIMEDQWAPYWLPLEETGCTYERGGPRLFAVDVPPENDIYRTYELLEAGEKAGVWSFQESPLRQSVAQIVRFPAGKPGLARLPQLVCPISENRPRVFNELRFEALKKAQAATIA